MDKTNQQFILQDGRTLGYSEYGTAKGSPIFYFHGFPGSRLDWMIVNDKNLLAELNVRIIAADRPGFGLSDYKDDRRITDWPSDIAELADSLRLEQFAVLGISGGGPYAAACNYALKDRITKTGIVCGMGPANDPDMKKGTSWTLPGLPVVLRKIILKLSMTGLIKDPVQFLSKSREKFSKPDQLLLDQPEISKAFIEGMKEGFRYGIKGANQEATLLARYWGFDLEDIRGAVFLWHGRLDDNVPVSVGIDMGQKVPDCKTRIYENEGHLTIARNHLREIIEILIGVK